MRYACIILIVLGLAASASAQKRQHQPPPPPPSATAPQAPLAPPQKILVPSLPTIGLPLPSIGLGLPSIGLPPPDNANGYPPPNRGRGHGPRGYQGPVFYSGPAYGYPAYGVINPPGYVVPPAVVEPPPPPAPEPAPITGSLLLDVEPSDQLQVFVDDAFIGSPREIGNEIALEPGTRHIELRADGYKPLIFNTQVIANRTITYRATMERDPQSIQAPAPMVAPTGSRVLYLIPGCYLGNVSPEEIKLPAGCDLAKMRTLK